MTKDGFYHPSHLAQFVTWLLIVVPLGFLVWSEERDERGEAEIIPSREEERDERGEAEIIPSREEEREYIPGQTKIGVYTDRPETTTPTIPGEGGELVN